MYDANGWSKYYGYGAINALTTFILAKLEPQNSVVVNHIVGAWSLKICFLKKTGL
jgi:hypothetical protein